MPTTKAAAVRRAGGIGISLAAVDAVTPQAAAPPASPRGEGRAARRGSACPQKTAPPQASLPERESQRRPHYKERDQQDNKGPQQRSVAFEDVAQPPHRALQESSDGEAGSREFEGPRPAKRAGQTGPPLSRHRSRRHHPGDHD